MIKTNDVLNLFLEKYKNNEFRIIGNEVQQSKTLEIQNAHFEVDKAWIIREPNYDYIAKELEWYLSESLNVNDIPGGAPIMWKSCADSLGYINSNYGWCVYSKDNGEQYKHCLEKLITDPHTREAIMIYNRPSMQEDYKKNGMHDFMCCQNMQYFINERDDISYLDCIVNFRSNDAVFGFNNDVAWARYVQENLTKDINNEQKDIKINVGKLYWNAGSLHIYERHFKFLDEIINKEQ